MAILNSIFGKKIPDELPDPFSELQFEKEKELRVVEQKEELRVIPNEKSFFEKLLSDIQKESRDGELHKVMNEEVLNTDIVESMKDYWKDNKRYLISNYSLDEFKKKVEKMKSLESEWKKMYRDLNEKERELKKEEEELKIIASHFMKELKIQ